MTYMAHAPLCIAQRQLDTALRLYFEQEDYYSVITLAGAAEEILGKFLKENGIENALDSLKEEVFAIDKVLGEAPSRRDIATRANDARNKLKHCSPGKLIEFDAKEEAEDMLDRAIQNVLKLVVNNIVGADAFTPEMRQVRPARDLKAIRDVAHNSN